MSSFPDRKLAHELTVYGFIRECCISCKMPDALIHLCFIMYFINIDTWKKAFSYDLSNEDRIATTNGALGGWKKIFGSIFVKKGEIQTWKLKRVLHGASSYHYGIIGIMDIDKRGECDDFFAQTKGGCGLSVASGRICAPTGDSDFTREPDEKETITMILDMTVTTQKMNGTLSYKFNEYDCGVAFANINVNKTYCLAMSLWLIHDAYEIIE